MRKKGVFTEELEAGGTMETLFISANLMNRKKFWSSGWTKGSKSALISASESEGLLLQQLAAGCLRVKVNSFFKKTPIYP